MNRAQARRARRVARAIVTYRTLGAWPTDADIPLRLLIDADWRYRHLQAPKERAVERDLERLYEQEGYDR